MTGQIIVPMCACVDVFGFRVMCWGPVDDVQRRVLVGRAGPLADVQGGSGVAGVEGGLNDV